MPPYTLRMHSTNSNEVLSLHTQNALNQLKSSAPLTHSKCTQSTEIKGSPYTLRMHSANSNEVLSLHTHNALNQLKSRLIMLECGDMHIQCFEIPPKSTNPAFVHLQTRDGLQSSLKLLQGSKSASKNPPELKLAPPTQNLKMSLNAHKQ
jgi:hypothetical protein